MVYVLCSVYTTIHSPLHATNRWFTISNFPIDREIRSCRKQAINHAREESTLRSSYITPWVLVSLDTEVHQGIVQSKLDCILFVRAPHSRSKARWDYRAYFPVAIILKIELIVDILLSWSRRQYVNKGSEHMKYQINREFTFLFVL